MPIFFHFNISKIQFYRIIVVVWIKNDLFFRFNFYIGHPIKSTNNRLLMESQKHRQYWKKNLKYLSILLSIWFLVSYVFGILLVDELNTIRLSGFKLGFWFAQQGSIYVFVILIFVYIRLMNSLDKKFKLDK